MHRLSEVHEDFVADERVCFTSGLQREVESMQTAEAVPYGTQYVFQKELDLNVARYTPILEIVINHLLLIHESVLLEVFENGPVLREQLAFETDVFL